MHRADVQRRGSPRVPGIQNDLLRVVEQAGQLAGADHAGLIDHQHSPVAEGLMAAVEVAQQAVAGGHLLEPSPCKLRVAIPVGAEARSR